VYRYGAALTALARVLPAVESELLRHREPERPIDPITSWLLDDCSELGLHVEHSELPVECSGFDEPGRWWGASYVLHGSRLGATVIVDRLVADLPGAPRSYFDAAADGARPAWFAFRVAAREAFDAGDADLGGAIDAARAVFASLLREFDLVGSSPTAASDGSRA